MTTLHSSTSFCRTLRHETPTSVACLRLRWSVSPAALGRVGRAPAMLELELLSNQRARILIDGEPMHQPDAGPRQWLDAWDRSLATRRVVTGDGIALLIAEASPLAVAIFDAANAQRAIHVSTDLPKILGLRGGRYELIGGELLAG